MWKSQTNKGGEKIIWQLNCRSMKDVVWKYMSGSVSLFSRLTSMLSALRRFDLLCWPLRCVNLFLSVFDEPTFSAEGNWKQCWSWLKTMQNNGKNSTLWPGAFQHRGSIVEFHRDFAAPAPASAPTALAARKAVHIVQITYTSMNCNCILSVQTKV